RSGTIRSARSPGAPAIRAAAGRRRPLDDDLLDSLRRERSAEVTLTLLDQVRIRLPVSLLGLTAALKARDARASVVTAP
ncbi:hypothetical protein CNY89_06180, partial [Amaricoccus sp. HAR-UPW-R2A-40]